MSVPISNNKLIAKNTLLLYARMLLMMAVSLYTSRIVLKTLGVLDFGLYNVVGGVVSMFMFFSSAMGNATQRYLTFALGKGDPVNLYKIFNISVRIHAIIAIIILILAETIGIWFLTNKMVIPPDRLIAAHWVYQFSIISSMVVIISVPYNALIIAHEKMNVFALISTIDVVLKLVIVYIIQVVSIDKLILYAALLFLTSVLSRFIYQQYCRMHFKESKIRKFNDKVLMKEMSSFAGWSLVGNMAVIGYSQGLNILLNIFFGPAVNAARGVAMQVNGAVKGFVTNFQTAVNPQITKSYSLDDFNRLRNLIFTSSKFSYYLLLCFVLPLILLTEQILSIWLVEVPLHSVMFVRLILIITMLDPLTNPLSIANNATGKIKTYQIIEGGLLLLILPIAYIFLKLGYSPESVFVVQFIVSLIVQVVRVLLVNKKLHFAVADYINNVVFKVLSVSVISSIIPIIINKNLSDSLFSMFLVGIVSFTSVILSTYLFGINASEKAILKMQMIKLLSKHGRRG